MFILVCITVLGITFLLVSISSSATFEVESKLEGRGRALRLKSRALRRSAMQLAGFEIGLKSERANIRKPKSKDFKSSDKYCSAVRRMISLLNQRSQEFLFSDEHMQNFVYMKYGDDDELVSSLRFMAHHILAVDLSEGLKTIHTTTNLESTSKSSGGLTRAAVGGLAFGGAGAVVGAVTATQKVSGMSTSITTEEEGEVTLRISTTSPELPIITIAMKSDTGKHWLVCIQRLLTMREHHIALTSQQQQLSGQTIDIQQRHQQGVPHCHGMG